MARMFSIPSHYALPSDPAHPEKVNAVAHETTELARTLHTASAASGNRLAAALEAMYGPSRRLDSRAVLTLIADAHASAILSLFSSQLQSEDLKSDGLVLDVICMMMEKLRHADVNRKASIMEGNTTVERAN